MQIEFHFTNSTVQTSLLIVRTKLKQPIYIRNQANDTIEGKLAISINQQVHSAGLSFPASNFQSISQIWFSIRLTDQWSLNSTKKSIPIRWLPRHVINSQRILIYANSKCKSTRSVCLVPTWCKHLLATSPAIQSPACSLCARSIDTWTYFLCCHELCSRLSSLSASLSASLKIEFQVALATLWRSII